MSPVNYMYSDSVIPYKLKGVPAFGNFISSVAVAVVQWAEVTRNRYAVTVIVLNSGVVYLSKFCVLHRAVVIVISNCIQL